jgi:hypothetical protein
LILASLFFPNKTVSGVAVTTYDFGSVAVPASGVVAVVDSGVADVSGVASSVFPLQEFNDKIPEISTIAINDFFMFECFSVGVNL